MSGPTPTPTGTPTGTNELLWQQEAQNVYNQAEADGETSLAADWLAFYPGYHSAHPTFSVQQVFQAFTDELLSGGLGTALQKLGNFTAQVPGAVASAGANAGNSLLPTVTNPLDFLRDIGNTFDKLTDPHFWLRIGEFIAGSLLLYLGLKTTMSGTAVARGARQTGAVGKSAHSTAKKVAEAIAVVPK